MKKKMMLVNYEFTTGTEKFSHSQIVSLRFEGKKTENEEKIAATDALISWFGKTYPESELQSVVPWSTIYADIPTATLPKAPDHYDGESLTLDQILQLIEETKPYTDFVVLKGLVPFCIIKELKNHGHYVNNMSDQSSKLDYTIIRWTR